MELFVLNGVGKNNEGISIRIPTTLPENGALNKLPKLCTQKSIISK